MYDDDETVEYEEIIVPEIIDEEDGVGGEEEEDSADPYTQKGFDDRAVVDQQAKEYDEMKRKKRSEITQLKQARLTTQAKLSKKERELAAFELQLRKSAYLDTRARVAGERQDAEQRDNQTREVVADKEVEEIKRDNKEGTEDAEYRVLLEEVRTLRGIDTELARKISLLEHELLRS